MEHRPRFPEKKLRARRAQQEFVDGLLNLFLHDVPATAVQTLRLLRRPVQCSIVGFRGGESELVELFQGFRLSYLP